MAPHQEARGGGELLIYRDAITFINVSLIKGLLSFNLILPLANYHCSHKWEAVCTLWLWRNPFD